MRDPGPLLRRCVPPAAAAQEHVEVLKKGHGTYKTGCGLAVVTLRLAEDKEAALQKMEGKLVYGRAMMVRGDRFA